MPSPRSSKTLEQRALDFDVPGLVAGVDEAGRGPLAGPVIAAAVILDPARRIRGLADSKLLSPARREALDAEIRAKALCVAVGSASVEESLRLAPIKVLVDGNQLPRLAVRAECVIGGDATVKAISAASIIAKVHRDHLCLQLDALHPQYGFAQHKGYASPEHLSALRLHGACAVHRRTFAPVREALEREGGFVGLAVSAEP